jgi:hypothetical protein
MMRSSCAAVALWWVASSAHAHPSPAEPPEFFPADCIIVVDKQQQASWHLDYAVLADDTAPEADHVSLADSKTHQFFALAGTLLERANDHVFLPFDDEAGLLKVMPTWLTADDVMRTAAGVAPEDMTAFTADQVSPQDMLESDPVLASALRPLVASSARVPITEAQALAGVDWDLSDVPPGVYQIAAYIFSPPYNGWAVRPGLIKVVDGSAADAQAPAVTLERVTARLFAGQGRRIRGCVDAPEGSTLELSTRVQSAMPAAFEPHATQAVSTGELEVCLANEGRDDVLEVRLEVHTPAGLVAATQSSDVLSLFSNAAACVASELLCCPEGSIADAGGAPDAALPMMPTQPDPAADAEVAGEPIAPQQDASVQPAQPAADVATTQRGGCVVSDRRARSSAWLLLFMLALLRFARRSRC